ncbi:MAG: AEC family transporter [Betaproteobacteria bacterium]|nr:AEC family transporter [Betaproteobacteria bacterium]
MFQKIIEITLPIFLIAWLGFAYSRKFKPDLGGANKLIVDLALPILIFSSLASKSFDPQSAAIFTLASIALIILSGLLAWPLARYAGASVKAFVPCVMFTNVGPIGIPLIALAYGPESLPLSIVLLVISNILHFTLGAIVMSGRVEWRMVYANPLIWATLLGLWVSHLQWAVPSPVQTALTMVGNVLVPMMLLSLGSRLASSQLHDVRVGVIASILTLVIRLAAVFLILQLLPFNPIERGAMILFACLPPAVFNFLLADKFHVQPEKVASTVVLGHVFSMIFLPLGIWLAFLQ